MIRQDLQNRKWQQKRKRGKVYMPSPLLVEELFVMIVEYVSTIFSNEGFEDTVYIPVKSLSQMKNANQRI